MEIIKKTFEEIIDEELFDGLDKLKNIEDKGKFFFTCLTEKVFKHYFKNESLKENLNEVKIYLSDLLHKFFNPKFSKYLYRSDIAQLKNKNKYELYEINKSAADQCLLFSSFINNENATDKIRLKKQVLTSSGKDKYNELSKDKISKIRNMDEIYYNLYKGFDDVQNCLNIMRNFYLFSDESFN